jgi:murein DD-endopeptidase MepM/ murein hydrolase activator NlpD
MKVKVVAVNGARSGLPDPVEPPRSFDPRTWTRTGEAVAPNSPSTTASRSPNLLVLAGAIVMLAVVAFCVAWLFQQRPLAAPSHMASVRPKRIEAGGGGALSHVRVIHGEIDQQSFYTSAVAAGVDDRLVPQITAALAFDFDFVREIHPGDVFDVAVEGGGGRGAAPRLLYVSLVTAEKTRALYRFQGNWYDARGLATQRALMRTPVEGARVTSTFGMRNHPVLGYTRMHKGVDFGVPIGTPVYASGDGTIDAIGLHTGYGFYLRIAHSKTLATAYGHLSAYPAGIKLGLHVRQGDVVAFSGNTGISTGPHLHYEVLVNGEQVNPLEYKVEGGAALLGKTLAAFVRERDRVDAARVGTM